MTTAFLYDHANGHKCAIIGPVVMRVSTRSLSERDLRHAFEKAVSTGENFRLMCTNSFAQD